MARKAGPHFLQIPGPSAVPERILRAISMQTIDHRGPGFAKVGKKALEGMKAIYRTEGPVIIYPASGTGAWEAALVNVLCAGDRVVMYETGHFSTLWFKMAEKLGLAAELMPGDWRGGADAEAIGALLAEDRAHTVKAVCVVHNETSTGCVTDVAAVRRAMDAAGHPALLLVDSVSGLASVPFEFDAWGVDVAVSGSQKGLMLPPGISFNAVSQKALKAHERATLPRSYWDWTAMLGPNATGYFPHTPATNLLYGLNEALDMIFEEGIENVWARHARHGAATRAAVRAWGLEVQCARQGDESGVLTAVRMPEGHSADALRAVALENYDISLGNGLSKIADRVFRIGHLGDFNDLLLAGTLAGVEMSLTRAGVPFQAGGVQAAMGKLASPDRIAMAAE